MILRVPYWYNCKGKHIVSLLLWIVLFIYNGGGLKLDLIRSSRPFFTGCLPIRLSRTLAAALQKLGKCEVWTPVLEERIFIEDAILEDRELNKYSFDAQFFEYQQFQQIHQHDIISCNRQP